MIRSAEYRDNEKSESGQRLFLDIGGVLLTDGWDRHARKRAAAHFKLESAEIEDRHQLTWDAYQRGKFTLDEYLCRAVFYQKRPFTRAQFRRFMSAQSKPYTEMIALVARLKARYGLKVAVVSNEGRELNAYRIRKFKLDRIVDFFISSCFVHLLKPDLEIFQSCARHRPTARQTSYLHRKHADVRSDRRRSGHSKHSSHGLHVYLCEIGFVRIAG